MFGIFAIILLILIIFIGFDIYYKNNNIHNTKIEPFITSNDDKLFDPPIDIKYQIPVPGNQLSSEQLKNIDTDILRNVRRSKNFSMTDEFDFYQMYSLIKSLKTQTYNFSYKPKTSENKIKINPSEKIIALNSGAINNVDLELFSRLKLELISSFNNLVIKNNLFVPYHPYQFFKIINCNMISSTPISDASISGASINYIFTLTIAREYKYQQFIIYYDVNLNDVSNNTINSLINYSVLLNKAELIGIPIPNTVQFHNNKKTIDNNNDTTNIIEILNNETENADENDKQLDYYYSDQVIDTNTSDVMSISDKSILFKEKNLKYIDPTEISDMDSTLFDSNSLKSKIEDRIMNVSRDKKYSNHRCFGLVNGISQELPQYNNPIFCKSFHPEINQNGIWDAPCQVNTDCPFYKANKNYPNDFGKCNKETGICEMPNGIIPIGYTKYGRIEPDCYNCGANYSDNKCCSTQAKNIISGINNYKSPDYIFKNDESYRKQFSEDLKSIGLLVNPSI